MTKPRSKFSLAAERAWRKPRREAPLDGKALPGDDSAFLEVTCPWCHSPPGIYCKGTARPYVLGRHYMRAEEATRQRRLKKLRR